MTALPPLTDEQRRALIEREKARMAEPGYRESLVTPPPPTHAPTDGELRAENARLWDAVDRLWGRMTVAEVHAIRADDPGLAELAVHAHHRMSHEP